MPVTTPPADPIPNATTGPHETGPHETGPHVTGPTVTGPKRPTPSHLVDGLDLASLRLLLAVDELGSVAQAARRLGIAQPSATVRLRNLERLLGVPLLERAPTGSELTDTGQLVSDVAVTLLQEAARVFEEAERGREGSARLVVGATRTSARLHLPALFNRHRIDGVIIDVIENDTGAVAHAARTGVVALGFVDGPLAPLGLRSRIVASTPLSVIASAGHRLAEAPIANPAEVVAAGLVVRREGSGTRDVVEAALAPHGFGLAGRLVEVASNEAVLVNVRSGTGLGIVPTALFDAWCDGGGLVTIDIGLDLQQPVRVCWAGTRPADRSAAAVVDALSGRSIGGPAARSGSDDGVA